MRQHASRAVIRDRGRAGPPARADGTAANRGAGKLREHAARSAGPDQGTGSALRAHRTHGRPARRHPAHGCRRASTCAVPRRRPGDGPLAYLALVHHRAGDGRPAGATVAGARRPSRPSIRRPRRLVAWRSAGACIEGRGRCCARRRRRSHGIATSTSSYRPRARYRDRGRHLAAP